MMKSCSVLVLVVLTVGRVVGAEPTAAEAKAAEKAIRAQADSFVESFQKRDAAAIASQWVEDGVYVDEDGRRFEGRKAIQAEYETLLKDAPKNLALQLEIDSVRLLNSQTAIEEGRVAITPQPPGAVRVMSRYTAVHTNRNGKWLMTDVRDTRVVLPPDTGALDDLAWLVGAWEAANKDTTVRVKYRWLQNKHFLARDYSVLRAGKKISEGLEVIGMDPQSGRITSWSFSGDGGYAVAIWSPFVSGWAIESAGVLPDGNQTMATGVLTRKDDDTLVWQSGNRAAGDTLLADSQTVTLKRSPAPAN